MWARVDVEIVRDVDPLKMGSFENADAEDGILLNHHYRDMRGVTHTDALSVVREELDLLTEIANVDEESGIEALIDSLIYDCSELGSLDVGVSGAVYALSAIGAAPISSCNGGLIDGEQHSSSVPHVLVSLESRLLPLVLAAAQRAEVGVINNGLHVEIYSDVVPKLNAFAAALLSAPEADQP